MKKIILSIIVFVFVAGSSGTAYYFYAKYQEATEALNNPEKIAQEETARVLAKLGQIISLPEDDEPTIATVLDKTSLANEPFFAKAENGDKVIIYAKSRKAILYRESEHKIIEFAPIELSQQNNDGLAQEVQPTIIPTKEPTPKTEVTTSDEEAVTEPTEN
ncbi:MAG: hypothetical protein IT416_01095 [Candidatus Pacebacteria bacterium]|nr:hypothetical protein [Candidatus Paceibacterota bacterium]